MATFEALKQQLNSLDRVEGITPVEILTLPEALHAAVRKMLKRSMALDELAGELSLPIDEARQIGEMLLEKGFLQVEDPATDDTVFYKVHFARMRKHNIPFDL